MNPTKALLMFIFYEVMIASFYFIPFVHIFTPFIPLLNTNLFAWNPDLASSTIQFGIIAYIILAVSGFIWFVAKITERETYEW